MICPSCGAGNADGAESCFTCGKPMGGTRPIRQGSLIGSRYEVLSLLGQGGMGAVYKARDRLLDEPVAIKVLRAEIAQDPDLARRFQSEIKLARKVSHRNVCRIHEYGEDEGLRYISMEYMEGVDLRRVLREKGGLPPEEAFEAVLQVCDGLHAIHDVGVIHRDLKTLNIMRDARGVLKLMDFGIAKQWGTDATATATGLVLGTPEYMSPEQARGEKVDFRSDVYALGVVVFEVFTGRVPFRADTPLGTILKHLQEPPPLDGPEAAGMPDPVKAVLRKALAKTPAERYATVGEMAEALRHARAMARGEAAPQTPTVQRAVAPDPAALAPPPAPPPLAVTMPPRAVAPTPPPAAPPVPHSPPPIQRVMAAPPARTPAVSPARKPWLVPLTVAGGAAFLGSAVLLGVLVVRGAFSREPAGTPVTPAAPATLPPSTLAPVSTPATTPRQASATPQPAPAAGPRATSPAPPVPTSLQAPVPGLATPVPAAATLPAPPVRTAEPPPAVSPAVEALMRSLREGEASDRWRAAEALGNMGGEAAPAVPMLVAALQHRAAEVRWRSAEALGKIAPRGQPAVLALVAALSDGESLVRTEAAKALGRIGPAAREAVPALAEGLRSPDVYYRREAAKAVAKIARPDSREAVPALAVGLRDKDKFVRMECARALGRIGPEARGALPALQAALKDGEALVAQEAAVALRSITGGAP